MNLLVNPIQNEKQPSVCQLSAISHYSVSPLSGSQTVWVNCLLSLPLLLQFLVLTSPVCCGSYRLLPGLTNPLFLNSGSSFHRSSSGPTGLIDAAALLPPGCTLLLGPVAVCLCVHTCSRVCVSAHMYIGNYYPLTPLQLLFFSILCRFFHINPSFTFKVLFPWPFVFF